MLLVTEAHYEDLQPGDLFRFDYPHHGEARFRPTWRKLRQGYERHDGTEWRPDIPKGMPMRLERITGVTAGPPVTDQSLRLAENLLGMNLPDQVRTMFLSGDGRYDYDREW